MPQKYNITAETQRTITDIISLDVIADSWVEAQEKAEQVLLTFPKGHDVEGVPYCWVEKRTSSSPEIVRLYVEGVP